MKKLKIVCICRINGEYVRREDVPPEQFASLVEQKIDSAMKNLGFVRKEAEK